MISINYNNLILYKKKLFKCSVGLLKFLNFIFTNKLFIGFVYFLIIINALILIIEGFIRFNCTLSSINYSYDGKLYVLYIDTNILESINLALLYFFTIEVTINSILYIYYFVFKRYKFYQFKTKYKGFFKSIKSYAKLTAILRLNKNIFVIIDFLIIILNWIVQFVIENDPNTVSIIRSLRLLKLLSRNKSMRKIMSILLNAIPPILGLIFLQIVIVIIYTIIGTSMFGDSMHKFFYNPQASLLTLLQIMTLDSWVSQIVRPMLIEQNYHPAVWLYFLSYAFISGIIVLNVSIVVFIDVAKELGLFDKKKKDNINRNDFFSSLPDIESAKKALNDKWNDRQYSFNFTFHR